MRTAEFVRAYCAIWAALVVISFTADAAAEPVPPYIQQALSDPAPLDSDRAHDLARKPAECIRLAGLKPGDRIADVYPGRGYFSRIFSRIVGANGRVYPIIPQVLLAANPSTVTDTRALFQDPAYGNVQVLAVPLETFPAPEPLDVVWLGQIYHDLPNVELGPTDITAMNRAIFKALKPGGVYVVTDHVAPPGFLDREPIMAKRIHRIDPLVVKQQVLAAGFVLEAESNMLANPADPHTASVFDASIRGKTDQFFFVFRKPAHGSP
jgi:predicted methyltransferase